MSLGPGLGPSALTPLPLQPIFPATSCPPACPMPPSLPHLDQRPTLLPPDLSVRSALLPTFRAPAVSLTSSSPLHPPPRSPPPQCWNCHHTLFTCGLGHRLEEDAITNTKLQALLGRPEAVEAEVEDG